jgi:acetyltransferase EpsM
VQVGAEIGAHTIINNGSGVGHDAQVGDFAHLAVSHVGAESQVEEGAFLGIGSVVLPRLIVGAWAMVGAGAVVMADVPPGSTVIGNPARETVSDREIPDIAVDV